MVSDDAAKLAVLINADNAQPAIVEALLAAMDLLYSGRFDGFRIVSSDSDFTRLAARIRKSGLTVYGFGEHKTPKPFVSACDKFIYIENITTSPPVQHPHQPHRSRNSGGISHW